MAKPLANNDWQAWTHTQITPICPCEMTGREGRKSLVFIIKLVCPCTGVCKDQALAIRTWLRGRLLEGGLISLSCVNNLEMYDILDQP